MNSHKKVVIKEQDIKTWLKTAKEEIDDYSSINRNNPKNEIDKALKHLRTSFKHYNECVKWWKNNVDRKEYHEAEKISKILHSEYVRLERERKFS